jgi:hypothetical protein
MTKQVNDNSTNQVSQPLFWQPAKLAVTQAVLRGENNSSQKVC